MNVLNVVNQAPVKTPDLLGISDVIKHQREKVRNNSISSLQLSREGFQPSNSFIFVGKSDVVNFGLTFSNIGRNAWVQGSIKGSSIHLSIRFQQEREDGKIESLSLDISVKKYKVVLKEMGMKQSKVIPDDEQALLDLLAELAKIGAAKGKKRFFLTKEASERLKRCGKGILKKVLNLLHLISMNSFMLYPEDKTIDDYLIDFQKPPSKTTLYTREMKYESMEIQIRVKHEIYQNDKALAHPAEG